MKEIKITFDRRTGKVTKEVSGFTGEECILATAFLDSAIGKPVKTEMKSEYFIPNPEKQYVTF
jgi:hypothetical protein